MAQDYMKDVARQLERLTAEVHEVNRNLKGIKDTMYRHYQWDDIEPPEEGTAIQNMKGCVVMGVIDFYKLMAQGDEE